MFEHPSQPLLDTPAFLRRLAVSIGGALLAIGVSLLVGMAGYHRIEGLPWDDAFLNASMLMSGMGPIDHQRDTAGKIFEGIYALYCGLAFISVVSIVLAPVVHRVLHYMHRQRPEPPKSPN